MLKATVTPPGLAAEDRLSTGKWLYVKNVGFWNQGVASIFIERMGEGREGNGYFPYRKRSMPLLIVDAIFDH